MTPPILFSCARRALRLSIECERSSIDYPSDPGWAPYMMEESKRHRERAADYLKSRSLLLRQYEIPLEIAA